MSRSIFVIVGLVCAVGIGACDREPDVEEIANGALDEVQLNDAVDANYDAEAGVVHLSGNVARAEDRTRANDAVRASVQGMALVANQIVVDGAEEEMADDLDSGIEERFDSLWENGPAELKDLDVDAAVENGVVTLSGEVRTAAEKTKVEEMARTIPGVTDVVNGVAVNPNAGRDRVMPDPR